jgi:hypothetical protein
VRPGSDHALGALDAPLFRTPKLPAGRGTPGSAPYHYYAGYSSAFVADVLPRLQLPESAVLLDPWNGSGTTTSVAASLGHVSYGFDINPALGVVARARLLRPGKPSQLVEDTEHLIAESRTLSSVANGERQEPLESWFRPRTAEYLRRIERTIAGPVTTTDSRPAGSNAAASLSPRAAFSYVALFQAVRSLLKPFMTSNPTWIKIARTPEALLDIPAPRIDAALRTAAAALGDNLGFSLSTPEGAYYSPTIATAASSALPLPTASVDAVITSPPYCTRIDYAIATLPELALLGFTPSDVRDLREAMIGTPTMIRSDDPPAPFAGDVVLDFLQKVSSHSSRASSTYYARYFTQYFSAMAVSLAELHRVTRVGGSCVLVLQDSYYKNIHLDLAAGLSEMAASLGWDPGARYDFSATRNKASMNPRSRIYRSRFAATESVLFLTKQASTPREV